MGLRELILEDRPLIFWQGDNPRQGSANGAFVPDLSGNARHGNMVDMAELGYPIRTGDALHVGWRSDGATSRRIEVGYDAGVNVTAVTVEAVAMLTSGGTLRALWNRNNDSSLQWDMSATNPGDVLRFSMRETPTGTFRTALGTTNLAASGRFHHLAATWNPSTSGPAPQGAAVYVDGKLEGTAAGSANLLTSTAAGVRFGLWLDGRFPWVGPYAFAAMYARPLSPQRIREHAQAFHSARLGVRPASSELLRP